MKPQTLSLTTPLIALIRAACVTRFCTSSWKVGNKDSPHDMSEPQFMLREEQDRICGGESSPVEESQMRVFQNKSGTIIMRLVFPKHSSVFSVLK